MVASAASASVRQPRTTVVDAVSVADPSVEEDKAATAAQHNTGASPAAFQPVPVLPYAMLYRSADQVQQQQQVPQVVLPQQAVATNVQFLPVGQRIVQAGLSGEVIVPGLM